MRKNKLFILPLFVLIILGVMQAKKHMEVKPQAESALNFDIIELNKKDSMIYSYDDSTSLISINMAFKHAGYALDENNKLGLSYIMLYLYKNSFIVKEPIELQNIIEENGFKIEFSSDHENFYISLKSFAQYKEKLLETLELFLNPKHISQKHLNQAKESILQYYEINKGNANFVVNQRYEQILFEGTDFAKNPYGNIKTMSNIELDDLYNFTNNRFTADNFNLVISGNISKQDAIDVYYKIAKNLAIKNKLTYIKYNNQYRYHQENIDIDKEQIVIKAYIPTIAKNHNNYYKYYIANYVIGGSGLNSILSQILREEQGLTYSVYSYFENYNDFSVWVIELSTNKENYQKALKLLNDTLENIAKNGISAEDLQRAKKYLTGSFAIYFNTNERISAFLLDMKLKNISPSIIRTRNNLLNSFELGEINQIIKKLIKPSEISIITAGKLH
ncbi:MAG: M16 family metallopeptidase [Rickettsiales bacterium]